MDEEQLQYVQVGENDYVAFPLSMSDDEISAALAGGAEAMPGSVPPALQQRRDTRLMRDVSDPYLMPQSTVAGDPDPRVTEEADPGLFAAGTVANVPKSAANLVAGIPALIARMGEAVQSPIDQIELLGDMAGGLKERYGGVENIKRTVHDDPVGAALDIASAGKGLSAGARAAAEVAPAVVKHPATKLAGSAAMGYAAPGTTRTLGLVSRLAEMFGKKAEVPVRSAPRTPLPSPDIARGYQPGMSTSTAATSVPTQSRMSTPLPTPNIQGGVAPGVSTSAAAAAPQLRMSVPLPAVVAPAPTPRLSVPLPAVTKSAPPPRMSTPLPNPTVAGEFAPGMSTSSVAEAAVTPPRMSTPVPRPNVQQPFEPGMSTSEAASKPAVAPKSAPKPKSPLPAVDPTGYEPGMRTSERAGVTAESLITEKPVTITPTPKPPDVPKTMKDALVEQEVARRTVPPSKSKRPTYTENDLRAVKEKFNSTDLDDLREKFGADVIDSYVIEQRAIRHKQHYEKAKGDKK